MQHSGEAPLGRRRPIDGAQRETLDERYRSRGESADAAAKDPHAVDPTQQVYGTADTHLFHREGCEDLEATERGSRVTFVSAYDAVDGEYAPCRKCAPFGR